MADLRSQTLGIRTPDELSLARRAVTEWATRLELSVIERTKLVTAASELGRNVLVHGLGGELVISEVMRDGRSGLALIFTDRGPGIADIDQAMRDGYSSARSMGLGLGGSRRLVNEFEISSVPGQGTAVRVVQWKRR